MQYFGLSSTGKVRGSNEDFFHVPQDENDIKLFVVADGMGGANAGEVASALAVADIVTFVREHKDETDIPLLLRKAMTHANKTVFNTSKADKNLENMGTTVVCALISGEYAFIANVGDSRCYIITNGNMEQVSVDHSFVQEMVDKGLLTEAEARNHPNKNLITRAVGVDKLVKTDVFCRKLKQGDIILLASDGLTGMIREEYIKNVVGYENDCAEAAKKLVNAANDAGGKDNITAVLIYV